MTLYGTPSGTTVVIAAYHALPLIDTQLDALAAQDYSRPFEVVVADNEGSRTLREHLERHPHRARLRLRWVDASAVPGTAHARNVGSVAGVEPFLAYCDQDDAVHPGWLTALTETAAEHGLVGGPMERDTLNDPVIAQWRFLPPTDKLPVLAHFLPMTFGSNLGIWRTVFDAIGGWDASFPIGGSDIEICWRAQLSGQSLGYSPDAMVAYRYRTTRREMFLQAREYNISEGRVVKRYAAHGARGSNPLILFGYLGWLLFRLPLLPWNWPVGRRGQWYWVAGAVTGRIEGSYRNRWLYL